MIDHHPASALASTTEAGVVTVHCAGELDLANAHELRKALLDPLHDGARGVVVDLTETTFCDSTVFSVLVEAYRVATTRNVPYAIAAGRGAVVRPLRILGLDRQLPLHTGPGTARAAVAGGC
ncbi:STAS domain-containing protein [Amycolatopsis sp. NPDC005003]